MYVCSGKYRKRLWLLLSAYFLATLINFGVLSLENWCNLTDSLYFQYALFLVFYALGFALRWGSYSTSALISEGPTPVLYAFKTLSWLLSLAALSSVLHIRQEPTSAGSYTLFQYALLYLIVLILFQDIRYIIRYRKTRS